MTTPRHLMRFSFADLLTDRRPATRGARMFCAIVLALMFAVTIGECLELIVLPAHVFRWLSILAVVDGVGLALLELNERGRTKLASKLLVATLWLTITICAATGGGIRTPATTYYLTVTFIAGLLLGRRWAVLAGAACCIGGLVLILFTRNSNLSVNEVRTDAFAFWMGTVVNMAIIIGLQYFAAITSDNALQQIRALSSRLVSLREDERTRISRQVHDHLGQLLTAMKLELHSTQTNLATVSDLELREKLNAKLDTTTKLADDLIHSVQEISAELRPGALDCLGLDAAIESETETFESRTNVRCECYLPQDGLEMPDEHATAVFRIFQEILTNIARHAKATAVIISLQREEETLLLEVQDNGVGIKDGQLANPNSLGILGMQERAEVLGGKVTFRRNRKGGTTVTVQIPLPEMPKEKIEAEESAIFHPTFVHPRDSQTAA